MDGGLVMNRGLEIKVFVDVFISAIRVKRVITLITFPRPGFGDSSGMFVVPLRDVNHGHRS